MESEDGTGSRHAHVVFKEMRIATRLLHFLFCFFSCRERQATQQSSAPILFADRVGIFFVAPVQLPHIPKRPGTGIPERHWKGFCYEYTYQCLISIVYPFRTFMARRNLL
jgi:hypothetical protein